MFDWLLKKYAAYLERKAKKKFNGIPVLFVTYRPDDPIPNMDFRPHPFITRDEVIGEKFKDLADLLRDRCKDIEVKA